MNDVNTGPEVAINAVVYGSFTLEADVKVLVITSPNVRPFFTGCQSPGLVSSGWTWDTDGMGYGFR